MISLVLSGIGAFVLVLVWQLAVAKHPVLWSLVSAWGVAMVLMVILLTANAVWYVGGPHD